MKTQRINAYIVPKSEAVPNGIVYYIEQYHDGSWVSLGGTYIKLEYAETTVSLHNMRELILKLKGEQ